MKNKIYFITGGLGFIGSNFVKICFKKNKNIKLDKNKKKILK